MYVSENCLGIYILPARSHLSIGDIKHIYPKLNHLKFSSTPNVQADG